jgi:glycosyltransferase involved in cell wall biosynthesis
MDGYGCATIQIADELRRLDRGVGIVDMRTNEKHGVVGEREWNIDGEAVAMCTPDWLPYIHADRLIVYTMFEATRLPAGWAGLINAHAQACLVPCQWCADVFRANGVTIPINVVKLGISPADYYPLERCHAGRPYTFLWSGTPDQRKGWDVAYRAFCQAFGHDRDVQLILHFRDPLPVTLRFGDPNVRAVLGKLDQQDLREMLREADCYVFPSRGEGWGSPPREAAATGLPAIVTNYGGLAEESGYWSIPIGISGLSPARYGSFEDIGYWAEPNLTQLAEQMRWCADNPETAREVGRRAAAWLRGQATYARTARGVLAALKQEAKPC